MSSSEEMYLLSSYVTSHVVTGEELSCTNPAAVLVFASLAVTLSVLKMIS